MLYVVSGDLAHSHKTDCPMPLYLPDPRWNMPTSDTALTFDVAIENWIKCTPDPESHESGHNIDLAAAVPEKTKEKHLSTWDEASCKNAEWWLAKATSVKNSALSCGICGFGILHGILSAQVEAERNVYNAHLFCRLAPTYYGMAVAAFVKRASISSHGVELQ